MFRVVWSGDFYYIICEASSLPSSPSSLPLPSGRSNMLGMQTHIAYEAGCAVCKHKWTPGLLGTQCCFGGYRRFLSQGSSGRRARIQAGGHTYEYHKEETRDPPEFRDLESVRHALTLAEVIGRPLNGHKTPPLLSHWPGRGWYRLHSPEWMHGNNVVVATTTIRILLMLFRRSRRF